MDTYYRQKSDSNASQFSCATCTSSTTSWIRCAGPNDDPVKTTLQPTECANDNFLVQNTDSVNTCVAFASTNTCLTLAGTDPAKCSACLTGYTYISSQNSCLACTASNCMTCAINEA